MAQAFNMKDLFGDSDDDSSDDEMPVKSSLPQLVDSDDDGDDEGDDDDDEVVMPVVKKAKNKKRKKLRKGGADIDDAARKKAKRSDGPSSSSASASAGADASGRSGVGGGDGFIDSDDDNKEILAEYRAQKEFDSDDDPDPGDDDEGGGEPEVELDELQAAMLRVSRKGRRKLDKLTDGEREELCVQFLKRMSEACNKDIQAKRDRQLGFAKIKMLPEVEEMAMKQSMQYSLLEHDLMGAMGDWLRPVQGALPSLKVRSKIIEIAAALPVEVDYLRKSGFGKPVNLSCASPAKKGSLLLATLWDRPRRCRWVEECIFCNDPSCLRIDRVANYLRNHPKETKANKKRLTQLVQTWARTVFGKTANYRRLEEMQMDAPVRNLERRGRVPA